MSGTGVGDGEGEGRFSTSFGIVAGFDSPGTYSQYLTPWAFTPGVRVTSGDEVTLPASGDGVASDDPPPQAVSTQDRPDKQGNVNGRTGVLRN